MKVLDSKFVKDFIKMADDGYHEGWHERNGGNLSYRIRPEEVETIRSRLSDRGEWTPIGVSVPRHNAVPHSQKHSFSIHVKQLLHLPYFLPYLICGSVGHQILYVDSRQKGNPAAKPSHRFLPVHASLLYRMEHIQARFYQIIHKKRIVTAGMQPEMHSPFMGITDNFLIQREIQFPENLRGWRLPLKGWRRCFLRQQYYLKSP